MLTHPLRLSIGGSAGMLVSKVFVVEGTLYLAREGRNGIEGKVKEKKRKRKQYQCITHKVVRIFVTVFVVNDCITVFRLQMRLSIVTRYIVSCCSVHPQHRVRWNKITSWSFDIFCKGSLYSRKLHTPKGLSSNQKERSVLILSRGIKSKKADETKKFKSKPFWNKWKIQFNQ